MVWLNKLLANLIANVNKLFIIIKQIANTNTWFINVYLPRKQNQSDLSIYHEDD